MLYTRLDFHQHLPNNLLPIQPFHSRNQRLQRNAIIPRIRRPQERMNMKFPRLFICQKHTRVVVKLDENHRALNPEVERVGVCKPSDPGEVCLGFIPLDLVYFERSRVRRKVEEVLLQDPVERRLLFCGEQGHRDTLVGHDAVVAVRAAEVSLVVAVPATRRHGWVFHLGVRLRF